MKRQDGSPFTLSLPLDKARVGGAVFCPLEPDAGNDTLFADWECPLLWKWVSSRLKIDDAFEGKPALRFNFARRTPPEIWKTNWSLWYDTALTTREVPPDDLTLRATLTFEEVTTGFGSDNNSFVRPWTGMVARMVDLRRYYYLCLEYPDLFVLYRRDDNYWTRLAARHCDIAPFVASTIELRIRGNRFEGFLDGKRQFAIADYAYDSGFAGLRATSESFVTDFSIGADAAGTQRFHIKRGHAEAELNAARAAVPAASVESSVDLGEAGEVVDSRIAFFTTNRNQEIFYSLRDSPDGANAALRTLKGEELWRYMGPPLVRYQATSPDASGCQDLVGFSREEILLIDGRNGRIINRRRFESLPHPPKRMAFMPDTMADLTGSGSADCFLFTSGANDPRIWALDPEFHDLWLFEAGSGMGHNNHVAVLDVNRDGREEVFAGGSLIDAEGREIWRQEELLHRLKAPNAGHVDATQLGFFCEDPDLPVIHMEGSSAGHLVADARDGSTLVDHPQGHVQGGCAGHFVPEEPGIQVAASCRHGNYGILAIYSGDGRRLSRFQPDYRTDCPHSINWDGSGTELLLIAKDPRRAGLYDWQGRCLVPLAGFFPASNDANIQNRNRDFQIQPIGDDPRDCLLLRIHNDLRLIRPAGTPPGRCYRPVRRSAVSLPGWVEP